MWAGMIEGDCQLADGVVVYDAGLVNLYGCTIGAGSTIAPFVEVQRGAVIGEGCKICSHAFICGAVTIGERVFVGHGVMFCNDRYPVIGGPAHLEQTIVGDGVSIGSGAVILPGVTIGEGAIVGAGAVVTQDVPALTVVVGNPACVVRRFRDGQAREHYLEQW